MNPGPKAGVPTNGVTTTGSPPGDGLAAAAPNGGTIGTVNGGTIAPDATMGGTAITSGRIIGGTKRRGLIKAGTSKANPRPRTAR
jgi:hypothetical protein